MGRQSSEKKLGCFFLLEKSGIVVLSIFYNTYKVR